MTYPVTQRELTVHLNSANWYLRPVENPHVLGPVDYAWHRYNLYPDSFTFGEGLLAGSSIPGSRRLVFGGWSPQWDGFYVSSMGGAAYTFHGVGVNYVALRGKACEPSVLLLNHRHGEIQVRLEPVHVESLWTGYADPEGRPLVGFFALQQALYDRYASEYSANQVRVFAVGPAAQLTPEGAIGSSPVRRGALSPVVDWAGRGGLGSRLLQYHNLVGCVFGGEWDDPDLRDSTEIDAYFMEHFQKKTIQADIALTEKYRYFPEFETGGTFGVNMREVGDRILSFNYQSVYATDDQRLQQHQEFILDHYLAQFNQETIQTKSYQHCGEPCPVVCKKMRGQYKKDFEPYQTLGPQVGVFDQRAAEDLNDYIDAMGFDAIQTGVMLSWIMELVAEGCIPPEDFGFPPAENLKFKFACQAASFDLVNDSLSNAHYAKSVAEAILFDHRCEVFRGGMRTAAQELDQKYGTGCTDRAVYLAHGERGYMAPNQYWVPGMLSPMPMMGKYYVYYGPEFLPPEALGRKHVERMTYELFNDNSGICRFHRKWAEAIVDEILNAHYGLTLDYKAHQFELAREIFVREGEKSQVWQSERLIDMVVGYLEKWQRLGSSDPELRLWLDRFKEDKRSAARDYWLAIQQGITQAFGEGAASLPEMLSPAQAKPHPA